METLKSTLPLSFGQERLWYHEQSISGSPVYNIPIAYHFKGKLNEKILEQSLQMIVQRHDILRTYCTILQGNPVQIIEPVISINLPLVDLAAMSLEQREQQAHQLAIEEAKKPFDLAKAPLWRFKLLRLEAEKFILLVTIHHIICDHWSLHLFMEELATIYDDISQEKEVSLPPLPRQYGEFSLWQRKWLEEKRIHKQAAYWQEHLQGNLSPLALPFDHRVSPLSSYQGKRQTITISSDLTLKLKSLSEQEGVTLFVLLLTAFKALLYQYTRQEDMIVCSPVAGRHRNETKGLIGYFNNIIALRTDLSGDPSFRQLMGRVQQVGLQAYKNMDLPFQHIVNFPNLKRVPLARAMFALQYSPKDAIDLPNLTISYPNFQNVHNGTANFEISLLLEEKSGSLTGVLDYKDILFEATTISEMIEGFLRLLEVMVTAPEQHLSSLPRLREVKPLENQVLSIAESPYVAPEKEIEQKIAKVWQEVLQLEKVSIYHNFFELGGHSLAIAQVKTQLEAIFEQEISVVDLFSYPTVKTLAQYLSEDKTDTSSQFNAIQNNAQQQKQALQRRKQLMKQRRGNNG